MKNSNGHAGASLFGDPDEIAVQRGLGEFRTDRPVLLVEEGERLLALPVDGIDADRLASFLSLCAPGVPSLAVTARRAKALGIETASPVLLSLSAADDAASILALAIDRHIEHAVPVARATLPAIAAIELAKLAHRIPALLIASADGAAAGTFAASLISVPADAVLRFRHATIRSLAIASDASVPLQDGIVARFIVFRDGGGGSPTAIIVGEPDFTKPTPVRLHSACLTGDVFGSRRCDCGEQLKLALSRLKAAGGGIILYLEQEGRGLGLANKIRAYRLQDAGLDTVDANTTLGFDDDERDYGIAARMLQMLGCRRVLLLTNNPEKLEGIAEAGIEIAGRMPLYTPMNADNRRYLTAKATRAGHWLDDALAEGGKEVEARACKGTPSA